MPIGFALRFSGGQWNLFDLAEINILNLTIRFWNISDGWPFGFQSCEILGFFASVQLAAANWMIALATAER